MSVRLPRRLFLSVRPSVRRFFQNVCPSQSFSKISVRPSQNFLKCLSNRPLTILKCPSADSCKMPVRPKTKTPSVSPSPKKNPVRVSQHSVHPSVHLKTPFVRLHKISEVSVRLQVFQKFPFVRLLKSELKLSHAKNIQMRFTDTAISPDKKITIKNPVFIDKTAKN